MRVRLGLRRGVSLPKGGLLIVILLVAVAATFLRQEGVPKYRTIWAEDGAVFAACAYERPVTACLSEPYAGYYHLAPRLGALVVSIGDPADLPLRLTLIAAVIAATAAVLVGRAVREVSGSSLAGLLAGAAMVLVYPAGTEVLGNLTNLHWILFTAAVVLLVCSWLGRPLRLLELALVALTGLTSPFAAFLPVLALGGLARHTQRAGTVVLVSLLATLPQLHAMLTNERTWSAAALSPWDGVRALGRWALQGWFGPDLWVPKLAAVALVGMLGIALLRFLRTDRRVAGSAIVALVALVLTAAATLLMSLVWNGGLGQRHMYAASALTVIAIAMGAGVIASRVPDGAPFPARWLPVAARSGGSANVLLVALILAFGTGFASSFRVPGDASLGPDVTGEIEALRASCTTGVPSIEVDISPILDPAYWHLAIPCRELVYSSLP